jgi:hypothetical protein
MANTCLDYCYSEQLGEYEILSCGADPHGGIFAMVLLECNNTLTNPSSGTEVNAQINSGKAHLIQRCSLSIEKPSPVTQDSIIACETPILVTYERKGIYKNPNVTQQNVIFHNGLFDGRNFAGMLLFYCGEDDENWVDWVDSTVKFTGGRVIPVKDTEVQLFDGEFTYRAKKDPLRYAAPTGVLS